MNIDDVLAAWREAEHRVNEAPADSRERAEAIADGRRYRHKYREMTKDLPRDALPLAADAKPCCGWDGDQRSSSVRSLSWFRPNA